MPNLATILTLVRIPTVVPGSSDLSHDSGDLASGLINVVSPTLIASTATVGLLMLLGILTFKSVTASSHIPPLQGVPQLEGVPVLGALPIYLKHGMPALLSRLIEIGTNGVSYAKVVNNVLVSVHDPTLVKEVLSMPEEIASREGDPGRMSWSPFWTLRRLIGNSLFNDIGPSVAHRRNAFIREFNGTKTNASKFATITAIAQQHANALIERENHSESADVDDIGYSAENFAIALWGDTLYANPDNHVSGRVISLSRRIITLAGDPWPSVWYSLQLLLRLVAVGEPTRSEAKLRAEVAHVVQGNIEKLEDHERNNPNAPLKTIRSLSMATGGDRTGPLSRFASEFTTLNLFGGHYSIGLNITWAMIELDKHPRCLALLMREINSVDTSDFNTVNFKMPYLDAVFNEINRLHPTVHATLRVVNREVALKATATTASPTKETTSRPPVVLKPGMLVYLSYFYLHTSPKFWGADADIFVPERFIDSPSGGGKDRPFMPYGYGPRNCVGYKFAILAAKVYLITLLKTYRVDVRDHDHEMKLGTILETQKPVAVKVTKR